MFYKTDYTLMNNKGKRKSLGAVAQPKFISPYHWATPFTRLKRETSFGSALKLHLCLHNIIIVNLIKVAKNRLPLLCSFSIKLDIHHVFFL